jgi:aspartate aminotransferase
MKTSQRLLKIPTSPIRKLTPYAQQAKAAGVNVYHLNIGDPDTLTPEPMLEVLHAWKQNPITYAHSQGHQPFLNALKMYYHHLGHSFVETQDIQITTGASEAISFALFATCEANDEVLVFEPFYSNYQVYASLHHVKLVPIPTELRTGFHLPDEKTIASYITPKTRAILICTPNNPTGTVLTAEEMTRLVAICKQHQLFLLSDEAYREFTYDNKKQTSLLSFMQEIPELAILIDSMSKRYNLCGARLGMLVSLNQSLLQGILQIAQGRLSSGLIDQTMAAALNQLPLDYLEQMKNEYQQRRDVLYAGLKQIPGLVVTKPEGAFYFIAQLPVADAEDFCRWLLTDFRDQNETIMLTPAAGFYATPGLGKSEVRIAYVLKCEHLKRCVQLLQRAIHLYNEQTYVMSEIASEM